MSATLGVQQVMDRFLIPYRQQHALSPQQGKVVGALRACRTEALGGHIVQCEACGFTQTRYHSCRNRHCPQCQPSATQQWCDRQCQHVLPVDYFHLVFTLPVASGAKHLSVSSEGIVAGLSGQDGQWPAPGMAGATAVEGDA